MTADQKRRVLESIQECGTFIEREEKRDATIRPADMQKHLEFCKAHKARLQAMLVAS